MKRVFAPLIALATICLIVFAVNMISNERMKHKFDEGEYEVNKLSVLGFAEPYISYYNRGCVYYEKGDYSAAIKEFEEALRKKPKGDRDCQVRINLALSMVKSFKAEDITDDNIQEIIDLLKKARNYLIENGCANENDDNGHNADAQTLKNEIDEFLKQLENQQQSQSESESESQSEPESESESESGGGDETQTNPNDQLKQKLEELQSISQNSRNDELQNYNTRYEDYNFDGANW